MSWCVSMPSGWRCSAGHFVTTQRRWSSPDRCCQAGLPAKHPSCLRPAANGWSGAIHSHSGGSASAPTSRCRGHGATPTSLALQPTWPIAPGCFRPGGASKRSPEERRRSRASTSISGCVCSTPGWGSSTSRPRSSVTAAFRRWPMPKPNCGPPRRGFRRASWPLPCVGHATSSAFCSPPSGSCGPRSPT